MGRHRVLEKLRGPRPSWDPRPHPKKADDLNDSPRIPGGGVLGQDVRNSEV